MTIARNSDLRHSEGRLGTSEGRWSARAAAPEAEPGGGAGLSTFPGWVRLSTCAWAPAPAIAGALHRWAGGYGHATEAHRSVVTAIGAVDLDWPSQAAEAFGGAS